jgi:transposase-like protein
MVAKTETEALARDIAALSAHKNSRRYPEALRARVVAWARAQLSAGASMAALCAAVDIGGPTLHRFLGTSRRSEQARGSPGFTPVRVAAPKPEVTTTRLVLRGPCGLTVEGLTVDDVTRLLKGLACLG